MKKLYESPEFELNRFALADAVCLGISDYFGIDGEFGDYETNPDEGGDDI